MVKITDLRGRKIFELSCVYRSECKGSKPGVEGPGVDSSPFCSETLGKLYSFCELHLKLQCLHLKTWVSL